MDTISAVYSMQTGNAIWMVIFVQKGQGVRMNATQAILTAFASLCGRRKRGGSCCCRVSKETLCGHSAPIRSQKFTMDIVEEQWGETDIE